MWLRAAALMRAYGTQFAAFKFAWPPAISAIFNAARVFSFSFEETAPECQISLSYSQKWGLVQLTPIVLCGLIVVVYSLGSLSPVMKWATSATYRASGKFAPTVSRQVDLAVGSAMTVLYYSYFVLLRSGIEVFDCVTDASGRTYLEADPSLNCDGPEHTAVVPYASMSLLVFGAGIPVLFAFVLWRHRISMTRDMKLFVRGLGDSSATNPGACMRAAAASARRWVRIARLTRATRWCARNKVH